MNSAAMSVFCSVKYTPQLNFTTTQVVKLLKKDGGVVIIALSISNLTDALKESISVIDSQS